MTAGNPEDVFELLKTALNAGDIDAAMSLYEPSATFVGVDGEAVTGPDTLREAFAGMVATKPTIRGKAVRTFQVNELCLVFVEWDASGTGPDGNPLEMGGLSTDVLRRQPDGSWLSVIDNPMGTAIADIAVTGPYLM